MTYKETTEYLFTSAPLFQNIGKDAYKEGLYNTEMLDEHFGHPHRLYKTIHIAGTNGKGSCSHTLASILQQAGYRVGLFTSPHLIDFRERIRVNGEMIPEQYVVDFVAKHRSFFEPLHPSFFELTTAMALRYFADEHVDIAVIEVGLGGRLDCTNIISPLISLITNISFDHVNFLGNTLAKIAGEKAGIIKSDTPVVIGEVVDETRPVFSAKAKDMNAPIHFAEEEQEIVSSEYNMKGGIDYMTKTYGSFYSELGGTCQIKNTNTILCAVKYLNPLLNNQLTEDDIRKGFMYVCENTGLMGRWQELGMVNDKDINGVLSMLPKNAVYYFTQASVKRAMPYSDIQALAARHELAGNAYPTVAEAYCKAREDAAENDFIYVGGSSFVVADLLSSFRNGQDNS